MNWKFWKKKDKRKRPDYKKLKLMQEAKALKAVLRSEKAEAEDKRSKELADRKNEIKIRELDLEERKLKLKELKLTQEIEDLQNTDDDDDLEEPARPEPVQGGIWEQIGAGVALALADGVKNNEQSKPSTGSTKQIRGTASRIIDTSRQSSKDIAIAEARRRTNQ